MLRKVFSFVNSTALKWKSVKDIKRNSVKDGNKENWFSESKKYNIKQIYFGTTILALYFYYYLLLLLLLLYQNRTSFKAFASKKATPWWLKETSQWRQFLMKNNIYCFSDKIKNTHQRKLYQ